MIDSQAQADAVHFSSPGCSMRRSHGAFYRLPWQDPLNLGRNRGLQGKLGRIAGFRSSQGTRQDLWCNRAPRPDRV